MGSGRWDAGTYDTFRARTHNKRTEEIYQSSYLNSNLDPKGVKYRESCDSADNPQSTPIIVALDVTGSMGMLADTIARQGLGVLFQSILDKKPVTDPHIMFMGVGDANCDRAPLQVSQFEADHRIIEQLTQLYLEHGGGGNTSESYHLPWYFAAFHTVHDAMKVRGKKGYLFTVGDEETPGPLLRSQVKQFIGDDIERDLSAEELLEMASRVYHVYHIIVEEGWFASHHDASVKGTWTRLMGQRAIPLEDHKKLAETIVSAIQVNEGISAAEAAEAWMDYDTRRVVGRAIRHLPSTRPAA